MSGSLIELLDSWKTTIAAHQTVGTQALPPALLKMMRSIQGDFEDAGFSEKFSGWLDDEAHKSAEDPAWLTKYAKDYFVDWLSKDLIASYVRGRDAVRDLFEVAAQHLIVAYVDTLWHPLVNETLAASKSIAEFSRAFQTAQVLAKIISSDRSAALWWYLGQTHHDYINRGRTGSLRTGTYVGDPIFYTTLAFAVVPGTASEDNEGNGEVDAIEAWQSDDVQTFWCITGYLMGGDGPRWTKFRAAIDTYRVEMAKVAKIKPKVISEMMEAYPPKIRVKQF